MDLVIRVTHVTNLGWGDAYLQAPSTTTKRYLKTLSLMGATRLASVIVQLLFSGGVFSFYFPDAGRFAPIRACVSSSTKRYR